MADLISSSIIDGSTIEASHITALYDALTGTTTYDNISVAGTSSYATTASYAENAGGATVDTGSLMTTASVSSNTITFTKGDATNFNITVDTGSAVTTDTGSLLTTASVASDTVTFTKGDASTFNITINNVSSASYAQTASYVTTAQTASYVATAQTASYVASTPLSSTTNAVNSATDPNGGGGVAISTLNLFVGSVQLASGTGTTNAYGPLAGKTNGVDAFITFGADHGSANPGETYTGRIDPTGYILITDSGAGVSNAIVNFSCWFIP